MLRSLCRGSLLVLAISLLSLSVGAADYREPQKLSGAGQHIEVAQNADGSLVAFFIESDKEIVFVKQVAPGSDEWTQKKSLGTYGNDIVVGRHADGRLALFNIGTLGNVLYHLSQTAPNSSEWTAEQEFKGAYGKKIEVISSQDGSLVLFFVGPDKKIGFLKETAPDSNVWSKPVKMGLYGLDISVGKHADGRIELVNIGTLGNVVYHVTQTAPNAGTWTEEKEIKGAYAKQIVLASHENSSLALFFLKPNKEVAFVTSVADSWSKPTAMEIYGSHIALGKRSDGRLDMFVIGTIGSVLSHAVQAAPSSPAWGQEQDLKGYATQMDVATTKDGSLDLFFVSPMTKQIKHTLQAKN